MSTADTVAAVTVPNFANVPVEVKLTEYRIDMPASLGSGATTFNVTNTGNETLALKSRGTESKRRLSQD
jgi:hypothetical protein